jgi:hypothetical protein
VTALAIGPVEAALETPLAAGEALPYRGFHLKSLRATVAS